jgi:hypothetical protein
MPVQRNRKKLKPENVENLYMALQLLISEQIHSITYKLHILVIAYPKWQGTNVTAQ